jgi:hypothetical protein
VGEVVGENTAYTMEVLDGRGMADDRSLLERSMDGGCRASTTEPELPGEMTGGFKDIDIENDQEESQEDVQFLTSVRHISRHQL